MLAGKGALQEEGRGEGPSQVLVLSRSHTATTRWASVPASLRSSGWASWPPEAPRLWVPDSRAAAANQPRRCSFDWDLPVEPACVHVCGASGGGQPRHPFHPSLQSSSHTDPEPCDQALVPTPHPTKGEHV